MIDLAAVVMATDVAAETLLRFRPMRQFRAVVKKYQDDQPQKLESNQILTGTEIRKMLRKIEDKEGLGAKTFGHKAICRRDNLSN